MSSGEPAANPRKSVRVPCIVNPEPGEAATHLGGPGFVWLDYDDPTENDIAQLAKTIRLHPLTVEDAQHFGQRPKVEEYEGYVFMVAFGVDTGAESGSALLREVHLVLTGDSVVTLHHGPIEALAELRARYADEPLRSEQFMVYKILEAVTSTFIPVLSRIDDDIDDLEQRVIDHASPAELQRIFSLKRDLVEMRRVLTPMRDMFARSGDRLASLPGLETDDVLYFRDLYDHLIRVSELVDSYRDLLSGATDMYLSTIANRQGEINKQLTIIATIFLPLTFLTGFFGQNFTYLVRNVLSSTWSFWVFGVGLLLLSVIGVWVYLRRKRWV